MRTPTIVLFVWSLAVFAPCAAASEARTALELARDALLAHPPKRDVARAMLERAAASSDDGDSVAEALARLGDMDEDDGAFAQAIVHDRASIAAAPDTPWAVRASDRIDWLLARSEGEFAPLVRLERVRRDAALSMDPEAIEALAREAVGFPPGMVRVEARMLVAEAWLGRVQRPSDAIAELRAVVEDPLADPLTAGLAERELVQALADAGKIVEAGTEARAHANLLDARFVRNVNRLARRTWWRRAAIAVIAVFGGLAAAALARGRRRGGLRDAIRAVVAIAPIAAAFAAFLTVAGGVLASRYEAGSPTPFVLLGAATLPLVLVARAWSAVGSLTASARVGRAVLCATTVLAAAFALLDSVTPDYLEGFGL